MVPFSRIMCEYAIISKFEDADHSFNELMTMPHTLRLRCFRYDIESILEKKRLGTLNWISREVVVMWPLPNQQEAFELVKSVRKDVNRWTRVWPQEDDNEYTENLMNLIDVSELKTRRRNRFLREAFRNIEFRCLRKAFAPGQSGFKRTRGEFEEDFSLGTRKE